MNEYFEDVGIGKNVRSIRIHSQMKIFHNITKMFMEHILQS